MEICVANRVPMANGTPGDSSPWEKVLNLLSRTDYDNYARDVKDASARIIMSCAASPEENWTHLVESLYNWEFKACNAVLSYIIHCYLHARNPSNMDDDTVELLQRLRTIARHNIPAIAKSPTSEIVNPVDRFIMLTQHASRSRHFSAAAYEAGMPELISAVLHGRFDSFGDMAATDTQRKTRNQICSQLLKRLEQVHEERSQEASHRMATGENYVFELRSAAQFDSRWRI